MSAVYVAKPTGLRFILGKKESGEAAVGRVLAKQSVDGAQNPLRVVDCHGALAAQVCLQVGHQKRGGNPFSHDVANYKAQPVWSEVEEIVVVAAHLPRLEADAGIIESGRQRTALRE